VRGGLHDVRWITPHGNLAEQPQGPRLLTSQLVLTGLREPTLDQTVGFFHLPSEEIGLPTHDEAPLYLPQQGQGVRRATSQRVGPCQMGSSEIKKECHVGLLTQGHAPLEQRDGLV